MTLLLLLLLLFSTPIFAGSIDDSVPSYLRGINWQEVKEHAKTDLRLSRDVQPIHYLLDLSLNVRGHAGASRSDFDGAILIDLNITKSTDKIELHSNGLEILEAKLINLLISSTPTSVNRISTDSLRETITIHANRTISMGENFSLQILYRGLARMNEYGLFENWNPKFNKTNRIAAPFVLASNNFPTGARFWFPCFDEPEFRATFELHISHENTMNVYSNTAIARSRPLSASRIKSTFENTQPLPTYQVALALNDFPIHNIELENYGKIRLVTSGTTGKDSDTSFDVKMQRERVARELQFQNPRLDIHRNSSEKLDVIVLDDTGSTIVQPGLITIERIKLVDSYLTNQPHKGYFSQLLVENHVTVRSTDQIWLNDMFYYFLVDKPSEEKTHPVSIPQTIYTASLHETSLADSNIYTTTKQFLTAQNRGLRGRRAAQILEVVHRLCPSSTKLNIENFIITNRGRFVDREDFMNMLSKSCTQYEWIAEFISDYINQPGRPFLVVSRKGNTVTIRQIRYLSSYFDKKLRDTNTRYTVPLIYTIDGIQSVAPFSKYESFVKFEVQPNSTFLIEDKYDKLYNVHYQEVIPPQGNISEEYKFELIRHLQKSLISGLVTGHMSYAKFMKQVEYYIDQRIFKFEYNFYFNTLLNSAKLILATDDGSNRIWRQDCYKGPLTWDEYFNNEIEPLWNSIANMVRRQGCMVEWQNSSTYNEFLEQNLMGYPSKVKPVHLERLLVKGYDQNLWREFDQFFFDNIANETNPLWSRLAGVVLNSDRVTGDWTSTYPYPDISSQTEYLNNLRSFVLRNPQRAAEMSNEIEKRLEWEFIRTERVKWFGLDKETLENDQYALVRRSNPK